MSLHLVLAARAAVPIAPSADPALALLDGLGPLTGERALILGHGSVELMCALIRGGFKIIPEIVSEILQRHPAVNEAVVLGVKDDRLGELPLAVVELRPGATRPETEALDAFLREHLPPYQVPAAYEFVETLPRTVSLKIARPEVRAMLAGRYAFA